MIYEKLSADLDGLGEDKTLTFILKKEFSVVCCEALWQKMIKPKCDLCKDDGVEEITGKLKDFQYGSNILRMVDVDGYSIIVFPYQIQSYKIS